MPCMRRGQDESNPVSLLQSPDVAGILTNLTVLWAATNRPEKALAQMEAALAIDDQTLGQI